MNNAITEFRVLKIRFVFLLKVEVLNIYKLSSFEVLFQFVYCFSIINEIKVVFRKAEAKAFISSSFVNLLRIIFSLGRIDLPNCELPLIAG